MNEGEFGKNCNQFFGELNNRRGFNELLEQFKLFYELVIAN